jgi:hypothetical protein
MVKAKTMYGDVIGQVSHASLNCFLNNLDKVRIYLFKNVHCG